MIGKLKSLVVGVQNRFTKPQPHAKPAGMTVADAFVSADRVATLRASGPKVLMGLPCQAPAENPDAEQLRDHSAEALPDEAKARLALERAAGAHVRATASDVDVVAAGVGAAGYDEPAPAHDEKDLSAKGDPEGWMDDPMVHRPDTDGTRNA